MSKIGNGRKTKPRRKRRATHGNPVYRRAGAGKQWRRVREWFLRRRIWFVCARLAMILFILGGLVLVYFAAQLPDIRALDTIKKQQGITIEAADGRVVANYGDVYGNYISYEQLPKSLIYAVLATEDRRFFEHHGVDFFGIARAMVTNVTHRRVVQGGSTVTQQVAKNVFLTPERSIKRKLQEMLLAFWLEARYSKKEIMAIYLNRVYLGGGTFGVDAASRRYFNKSAKELTVYESALLAGLLKAPSRYSPAADSTRARARVKQVLVNMADAGYLKENEIAAIMTGYAKTAPKQMEGGDVRYYTDWIVDEQIPGIIGDSSQDLIVTTTLDSKLQHYAQDSLQNIIAKEGDKRNIRQGAIVVMRPDGMVQALVGGVNYAQSQYNRATQAKRQPGSSFKLFVYLAALEAGMTPQSIVEDAPISLQVGNKTWTPENFQTGYWGEIPMVVAMRNSLNTVAVRLALFAGVNRVAQMAMRLGIPSVPAHPSIALGSVEATVLEMTSAYAHLANDGNKVAPYGISKIRTRTGKVIYSREAVKPEPVLAKGTVEMMNYMLLDVVARGTGTRAALAKRQAAGKTGTSQDFKDAWFIGFTPQLVAGVWVGNDDNKPMKKVTGGLVSTTIWHDFMTQALQGQPAKSIPSSAGSSEGLLPWLFGDEEGEEGAVTAPEHIPEDSPFGLAHPPTTGSQEEPPSTGFQPSEEETPAPREEQVEHHSPNRARGNESLFHRFVEKLPENPEKGKVEHTYPDGGRRR